MLVFFDSRGMVYTNYVPKGKFHCWSPEDLPEAFEEEDARDGGGGVVPPLCDNALVHSVKGVQEFLAKKASNCSSIPPIQLTWPLLTSCSPKLKKELVGYTMTQGEFKKESKGS